jgi:hypothetical protein
MTTPQEAVDEVAVAKARLLQRLTSSSPQGNERSIDPNSNKIYHDDQGQCPNSNTRVTIDMIITIVGELYGQRDLLEFRDSWGGEMGLWG